MPEDTAAARVLVADDTPDIRALFRLVLSRQADFVVVAEAADGREAVEMAVQHRPDIVLLDLGMPLLNGLEAIPQLRAAVPYGKIVVLSGFNAEHMAQEALDAGADGYVQKGAAPTELLSQLRHICGDRRPDPEPEPEPELEPEVPRSDVSRELSITNHELMGPLAVIEGFASLLERRPEAFTPETVSEHAASIVRSAQQLRGLLHDIADSRRLEMSELAVSREHIDVAALVREVAAGWPTTVVRGPDHVTAFADPERIRQVVDNLLSNATRFSPVDTAVAVDVGVVDDSVSVSVRDYGPGVALERRAGLFDRFSRPATTDKGLGLGLFISRGIARAHGGELTLVDTVDGPGATFVLRLPLH